MKYLITYRDIVDGSDKIMMVIFSDKNLLLELEVHDEVEDDLVQYYNGGVSNDK